MTTGTLGLATNLVQGFTAAAATIASPPPAPSSPLPLYEAAAVKGEGGVCSGGGIFCLQLPSMLLPIILLLPTRQNHLFSHPPLHLLDVFPLFKTIIENWRPKAAMTNTERACLRISRRLLLLLHLDALERFGDTLRNWVGVGRVVAAVRLLVLGLRSLFVCLL